MNKLAFINKIIYLSGIQRGRQDGRLEDRGKKLAEGMELQNRTLVLLLG